RLEASEETARLFQLVRMDLEPGIDKGTDQPGPYRALVIGRVAGAQIAKIARLEIGFVGRQRAQSEWRQQFGFDRVDDLRPALPVEHRMRKRNCENLVRAEGSVVAVLAIDDVVKITALLM